MQCPSVATRSRQPRFFNAPVWLTMLDLEYGELSIETCFAE